MPTTPPAHLRSPPPRLIAGVSAETPLRHRKAGRARSAQRRESGAMPQGAGFSGDRGGLMKRGPRRSLRRGKKPCSSRKPSSFWTGDRGLVCSRKYPLCKRTGGPGAFRLWYQGPPAAFLSTFRRWKVDDFPAKQVLRGPRLIKPPRSPEKPAPCGMTAALAAEARFAGRQRRRCGVSAPAGAELFPPADTVGPGSFDRISRCTQRLSSSRYYGSRARRGWSGGTDLR